MPLLVYSNYLSRGIKNILKQAVGKTTLILEENTKCSRLQFLF